MLTDIDYHLLGLLHVDGPAANALLAAKCQLIPAAGYQRLYRLRRLGHVSHGRSDKLYRVTERGQEVLAQRPRTIPGLTHGVTNPGVPLKSKEPRSPISPPPRRPRRQREKTFVKTMTVPWVSAIHDNLRADVGRGLKFAWTRLLCFGLPAFASLRADEAAGLNIGDVHAHGPEPLIHIRREITKSDAGVRDIPLYWNKRFYEDVRDYLLFRCRLAGVAEPAQLDPESPFVISLRSRYIPAPGSTPQTLFDFAAPGTEARALSPEPLVCHGQRINRRTVRKYFMTACAPVIDLTRYRVTTHTGRHTFCSLSLGPGRRTLAQVKDAAGHSDISITSRYLHALRDPGDDDCMSGIYAASAAAK